MPSNACRRYVYVCLPLPVTTALPDVFTHMPVFPSQHTTTGHGQFSSCLSSNQLLDISSESEAYPSTAVITTTSTVNKQVIRACMHVYTSVKE